jgi:penicillin-binding protein 1A
MMEDGKIKPAEAEMAKLERLEMRGRGENENVRAEYYAEEVRRELVDAYGNTSVLKDGYAVRTSLDPKLQIIADNALRRALINFDQSRTGYRGPVTKFTNMTDWSRQLEAVEVPPGGEDWKMGVVLEVREDQALLGFEGGGRGLLPFNNMRWARPQYKDKHYGPAPHRVADVVNVGDVVLVDEAEKVEEKKKNDDKAAEEKKAEVKPSAPLYRLMQVPKIQGAFVAVDPHTGRVLALVGGFSNRLSSFNRATQAMRQEGSSFKPFVYLAALDNGFTPSSLINDAPIELSQGPGMPMWSPQNFDGDYMGVMTMRRALEKSRNVVTVRLANQIGMEKVIEYAKKFGIVDDMPPYLAYCLGAKETSLLRLTTAYAMLVNGGKKILPSFIDRIQDNEGKTIWKHDRRPCDGCNNVTWNDKISVPDLPDTREQINDPRTTYQIVSLLEGVATRGTAAALHSLGKTLAGKTGTTNDSKDLWFVGFSPNLAAGVFVGYDEPTPLGEKETGGTMSLPIFKEFMEKALADKPDMPFRVPPGVQLVRVDPYTGKRAFGGEAAIYEPFLVGTDPESSQTTILGGGDLLPEGEPQFDEDGNLIPGTGTPPPGVNPNPGAPILPPSQQEKPPGSDMGTGGLY